MDEKLDKIIELLTIQNKLLSSLLLEQKSPGSPTTTLNTNDIRKDIDRRIQEAQEEARIKMSKMKAMISAPSE